MFHLCSSPLPSLAVTAKAVAWSSDPGASRRKSAITNTGEPVRSPRRISMSVPWRTSATTSVEIKIATIKIWKIQGNVKNLGVKRGSVKREAGKVDIALEDGGCASMATPAVAVRCSSHCAFTATIAMLNKGRANVKNRVGQE